MSPGEEPQRRTLPRRRPPSATIRMQMRVRAPRAKRGSPRLGEVVESVNACVERVGLPEPHADGFPFRGRQHVEAYDNLGARVLALREPLVLVAWMDAKHADLRHAVVIVV